MKFSTSKDPQFVISMAVLPVFLIVLVLIFSDCIRPREGASAQSPLHELALKHFAPLPADAFGEGMEQSDDLTYLGKMLFFEPRLSKSGLISCNTCHNMATFGVDNLPLSVGHGWQKGPVNAPTVLNAALHRLQFWDGRAADVEQQATMPILDPLEMAATEEHVLAVLTSMPEYVERFSKAFPGQQQPLTFNNVGIALGAFERLLLTPSRFDAFLRGDEDALNEEEKKGLATFIDAACTSCHGGVALGGQTFAFFQSPAEKASGNFHPGRFGFTGRQSDKHFFKVPSLLNIAGTYPYLHDGSEWSLENTVYIVADQMLGKQLTAEENQQIRAFLESLSGQIPAFALELPLLPPSTPSTPRPAFDVVIPGEGAGS